MADTGFLTPTVTPSSGRSTDNSWFLPSNAYIEDGVFANGTLGNAQSYGNFSFSIPLSSTIVGIEIIIKGYYAGTGDTLDVGLYSGSTLKSTSTLTFVTSNTEYDVGGSSSLLGWTSPAVTDFSNSNFSLVLSGDVSKTTYFVDGIKVKIYYTYNPPTVTTQAVTNNTATLGSATGNGNVTAAGDATVTDAGIVYNTTGTPTISDTKVTGSATSGAFTASLTGLIPGTLYYVRAYATSAAGTSYGSQVTFTAVNFLNPTNSYADGGTYCTAGGDTGVINVQLSGDGGVTWSSTLSNTYTGVVTEQTFGNGTTELWGSSWLGSNVSDTNFQLRISCGTRTGFTHVWKTFGFAPASNVVLTGIAVKVKGSWTTPTTSIGHISVEILYGTSTVPVAQGSLAYASDAATTGALETYNGTGWKEIVDTSSTQALTGKQTSLGVDLSKNLQDTSATVSNISLPTGHNFTINGGLTLGSGQGITYTSSSTLQYTITDTTPAFSDTTSGDVSTVAHGFAPKLWGSALTAWTPSYSASGSMTYGTVTTTQAAYVQVGKTVFFRINATGTTGGTAATDLIFSIPVTAKDVGAAGGAIVVDGGASFAGCWFLNDTSNIHVKRFDTGNWGLGAGRQLIIAGFYEAA